MPVPPGTVVLPEVANKDRHPGISLAYVEEIQANAYQPRHEFDEQALGELAQSIRENGVIQPLVVRKGATGGYQLIAGERRLRAAKLAGLKQVPVVIRRSTDKEALELALVENIQRRDLGCIEEGLAYQQLLDEFSLTQEEVAQRVGKDRATIANTLRLLKLPQAIIDDLKAGRLSFGHGKALLALEDNDQRLRARSEVLERKLSVRATEELVDQMKQGPTSAAEPDPAKPMTPVASRLAAISQDLTRSWSTRVELKGSERRGKILIHYASRQDLDRLLEILQNQKI
jgi:ParB family chromosome partitioning protein